MHTENARAPGPFTAGCTRRHLPGYVTNLAAFKQKGIDAVVCVAVADASVMQAWREANNVPAELVFLGNPCLAPVPAFACAR